MVPADHNLLNLLEGCKRQLRESQKVLYEHYYGYAMSICMRYTQNQEDALEILNDGFLKVFRSLPRFVYPAVQEHLPASFAGWLKKIMARTAIDHHRAAQRTQHQQIPDENRYTSYETHPLDNMSYDELIRMVQTLSPAYRAVFNLFVIDGISHEEIAAMLGISVGTSKSNLSKAREHLRNKLKKTDEEAATKYER